MAKKTIKEDIIWAYALKNALEHNGECKSGSVLSGLFAAGLDKKYAKEIMQKANPIIKEVNDMGISLQKIRYDEVKDLVGEREQREGLPELPNVGKKGVVMRVAPSPSGPLHVMHAINASLSFDYVQKYGGIFYARIEDTNPGNIDPKAYDMLEEEFKWLTKDKAKIVIQSDRMELYYKYAEKLLKKKASYVCTCDNEGFKELIKKQVECPCRVLLKKDHKLQLERWKQMLEGKYKPGEVVLRFKADLKDPNPAMRDFPLARINLKPHPRQDKRYNVWPLMNLAVAVDDIEMKMTHIIRGKDHRDNAKRQEMIFKVFKKKYPWTAFLGRYHFTDLELSSSKFKEGIQTGKYKGWDDPKLPTVVSLRKRGYNPEAFWRMAEHIGLSEVDKTLDQKDFFKVLDGFNK